ncbi:FG-GAP-like repeat-containing protein [Streptomyces sp. NPDC059909]|uniref:FG-GAP-like repeat-containing protein n=1 Tax=Streptomyces sp. NPDC059909 TaxID=3346998 RepID=UPI0036566F3A
MHIPLRRALACAATAALAVGGVVVSTAHATNTVAYAGSAATAPAKQLVDDFNGDGYRDVVLNLRLRSTSSLNKSGAVMVLNGSASGLSSTNRKLITEATSGVPGTAESTDWFGTATTTGDFDGDGYADLAVSAPGEDYVSGGTSWTDVGRVTLIWGGPEGLTRHGGAYVALGTPSVQGRLAGMDLASGDFDGDGKQDLAVADGRGGKAGTVLLGPFTRTGTPAAGRPMGVDTGAPFTYTQLAAGDITGDGVSDLLVSYATRVLGSTGKIHVLRGGAAGPTDAGHLKDAIGNPLIHREGEPLAIADVDRDGRGDTIVPEPFANGYKGRFTVVHGGTNGQDPARKPVSFDQDTPGVPDTNSDSGTDHFGGQVAVGDVNGDGYADVIATSRAENHSDLTNPGKITVLRGGPGGLTGSGSTAFTQNTSGVPGVAIAEGAFGEGAKAVDTNGDGRAEALIGVLGTTAAGVGSHDGGLWVLPGSATGTTATGSRAFAPAALGLPDSSGLRVGSWFNR